MNEYCAAYETSLSKLSETEWRSVSNHWSMWAIDGCVAKCGRQWHITLSHFNGFGLFKTKRAAMEAVDNLILAESHWRAHQRKNCPCALLDSNGNTIGKVEVRS